MRPSALSPIILFASVLSVAGCANHSTAMNIEKSEFGKTKEGQVVEKYVLTNKNGVKASFISAGATWIEMFVPDKAGKLGDVIVGYNTIDKCLADSGPGATTGRYANRIAKGKFTLDGKEYTLATNNGPNHLHGGLKNFSKINWKGQEMVTKDGPAVRFTHKDPDGANGYPGNLDVSVTYTLTDDNAVRIDYRATTDKPTVINLTNHAYFNLSTYAGGTMLDHILTINADRYTPVDDTLIPTGELAPVKGTPLDFTKPMPIGARINDIKINYDHNFVLNTGGKMGFCARLEDPKSGRVMEVFTDKPGVQLYSANHFGKAAGKDGIVYPKHGGVALETQLFPDSPNKPNFPSSVLRPGQEYKTTTIYKFSVAK